MSAMRAAVAVAATAVALSFPATAARADSIDAAAMMGAFTTITLGDHTAYRHSQGKVHVGGDLIIGCDGYYANSHNQPDGAVGAAIGSLIVAAAADAAAFGMGADGRGAIPPPARTPPHRDDPNRRGPVDTGPRRVVSGAVDQRP